jgi:hypothetical protein
MATETIYRSSFSTEDRGLSVPPHRLTELRLNTSKSLALDRFLCPDYLAALTGTSYGYMMDLCTALKTKPYPYIKICDEQTEHPAQHLNVKRQYELTPLGAKVVFDTFGIHTPERRKLSPRMYEHQIMGDHAMASFRIGVAESDRFAMLTRDDLLCHPSMPEKTRTSKAPDFIPLGDTVVSENGKVVGHAIRPDREMFVIRDLQKGVSYFFPGFEIGTGSETHRPTKPRHDHSLTESKFADYITIIDEEIYHSHFGAPNFFIPFIEPNIHRIENMMVLWKEMTAKKPWVRPSALFKTHHAYTEKYKASGKMLTESFHIVGEDGRTTTFSLV